MVGQARSLRRVRSGGAVMGTREMSPMEVNYRRWRRDGDSASSAFALARAEMWAGRNGRLVPEWHPDDSPDLSWCDDCNAHKVGHSHKVYGCVVKFEGEQVASLWGIVDPDNAYMRRIEAELALEVMTAGGWYFSCVVPYCASALTEWHGDPEGSFSTLTRGAFKTEADAVAWARANLNGAPYSIRRYWGAR